MKELNGTYFQVFHLYLYVVALFFLMYVHCCLLRFKGDDKGKLFCMRFYMDIFGTITQMTDANAHVACDSVRSNLLSSGHFRLMSHSVKQS